MLDLLIAAEGRLESGLVFKLFCLGAGAFDETSTPSDSKPSDRRSLDLSKSSVLNAKILRSVF